MGLDRTFTLCRMIALAYKDFAIPGTSEKEVDALDPAELESELTLIGLVGIEDPIRPEVPAAIDACHRAGISVRMLTGGARSLIDGY